MKLKLLFLLAIITTQLLTAYPLKHQDPDFSIDIPDSFVQPVVPPKLDPEVLYYFVDKANTTSRYKNVIQIKDMKMELTQASVESAVKDYKYLSFFKLPWKGHQINVFQVKTPPEEPPFTTFNAQVPLKGKGIQLSIAGSPDQEQLLLKTLEEMLLSLEGQSSWLTKQQKFERKLKVFIKVGIGCIIAIIILRIIAKISDKNVNKKEIVKGGAFDDNPDAEVEDAFKKPEPKPEPPPKKEQDDVKVVNAEIMDDK